MTKETEIEKAVAFTSEELIGYAPDEILVMQILKKNTGDILAMSFDKGKGLKEKTSPFDSLIQIIGGNAEIIIRGISIYLIKGQSIVVPAHSSFEIISDERFKLIITVIKSGYEF